jgi:transcriptional regulator with XRE-family HTH domain
MLAMDIRKVFGRNLRRYRKAAGLSQEELAHRAGVDRTYISSLERALYGAGIEVIDRIARELDCEAADLLKPSEKKSAPPGGPGGAPAPLNRRGGRSGGTR